MASCFTQLEHDLTSFSSRRFHVLERSLIGPIVPVGTESHYAAFVRCAGSGRLFRRGVGYRMSVVRALEPDAVLLALGRGEWAMIGHSNTANVFLGMRGGHINEVGPVYTTRSLRGRVQQINRSFEGWFAESYLAHRQQYSASEWLRMAVSPPPFSEQQLQIAHARKQFSWRVLNLNPRRFETEITLSVRNKSHIVLPYISLDAREVGGVQRFYVPTSGIPAGTESVARASTCFRGAFQIFDAPEPLPEDLENYREFDFMP